MSDGMWTFARFEPGQSFGAVTIPLDAERVAGWTAIYGAPQGDAAPAHPDQNAVIAVDEAEGLPGPSGNRRADRHQAFDQMLALGVGAGAWLGGSLGLAVAWAPVRWFDLGLEADLVVPLNPLTFFVIRDAVPLDVFTQPAAAGRFGLSAHVRF